VKHNIKSCYVCLLICANVADKRTHDLSAVPVRRPEFYSSVNQCVCVDNSTYETVLCKSVQAYVKAGIFVNGVFDTMLYLCYTGISHLPGH